MKMTNDLFYHKELFQALESNFIKEEWFPLYEKKSIDFDENSNNWSQVYGYLVDDKMLSKCLSSYKQDQEPTERIAVMDDYIYRPFIHEGIEPLIVIREFSIDGKSETYTDISEELILYYKLFEEVENKHERNYYYIKSGVKSKAIKVVCNNVYIKNRFLVEYLSIRRMNYMICFSFQAETSMDNPWNLDFQITPGGDKGLETKDDNTIINKLVRPVFYLMQSWVMGKKLLRYENIEIVGCHYDGDCRCESFIVGLDKNGKEIEASCDTNQLKPVFFSKDVLNKYYSNPVFNVEWNRLSNRYFSLKMDNNHYLYVVVLLKDLASLPYKEQLHWKAHNISPSAEYKLSSSFCNSMFYCNWNCGNETEDLLLKEKYDQFNNSWYNKYKWYLFKPLSGHQADFYKSLHLPTSNNNVQEFCDQIETMALIFVDSVNVKILKSIVAYEEGDKSIILLEKYLIHEGINNGYIIEFLRHLQTLRSGITRAHRLKTKKDSQLKNTISYFHINEDYSNVIDVAKIIFSKAIDMIEILSKHCEQ